MNGAQLKKSLEYSVRHYNTFRPGDLTVSFNPRIRFYLCDMFEGINYEINLGKEPGSRIENLTRATARRSRTMMSSRSR